MKEFYCETMADYTFAISQPGQGNIIMCTDQLFEQIKKLENIQVNIKVKKRVKNPILDDPCHGWVSFSEEMGGD